MRNLKEKNIERLIPWKRKRVSGPVMSKKNYLAGTDTREGGGAWEISVQS